MRRTGAFLLLAVLALAGAAWAGVGVDDCADESCGGDCAACPCCPIQAAATAPPLIAPAAGAALVPVPAAAAPLSCAPRSVFHVPKPA